MDADVAVIDDPRKARAMLAPLRQQILAAAHQPASATAIAATLGLGRQKVNYHVRALADAGLLRRAGRRQRRGLVEQRWVATSRAVVIAPLLVPGLAADHRALGPELGATYLLAMAATMQREVAAGARAARRSSTALDTLALDAELRFADAAQRARFADAIAAAVRRAIADHTSASAAGPTYRFAVGCYPIQETTDEATAPRTLRESRNDDRRVARRRVAGVGRPRSDRAVVRRSRRG